MNMIGCLALEDGRIFKGTGFGAEGVQTGELVFNTSMTGYQEILTDPSYHKQIVTMTVSHVGNTGINLLDPESERIWVSGFVVRSLSPVVSNWREQGDLDTYLKAQGIMGLSEVATRALVRHIRSVGVMRAAIAHGEAANDPQELTIPKPSSKLRANHPICPAGIWSMMSPVPNPIIGTNAVIHNGIVTITMTPLAL